MDLKTLTTQTEKQILADNHYFYDGNGNQIRREGLEGTTGYAYDGRNRLTEISYPSALGGYTEKLSYDAAGNRIRRETEQEITTYRYDNCNRLQELHREYKNTETSTAQPQIIRYTYDRQGNMLSEGEKKYSYDSFGRMVRAEVPVEHRGASNKPDEHAGFNHAAQSTGETFGIQENSSATREFQVQINRYDGEGLRHEMEENGRLIKFLYNEDREVVAEETGNGTITRYIRGLGIISSDSEEAKTYYHYVSDEQGSITHVLSEDAEILNHYSYDAFGNIIEKTEKVENRFCYNGEMLDPVTQQYYLRARFYNPVIGRFTQEDTYYGDGLNLYQYCQANPVGYVDPSGHNCETTQSRYNSNEEQHPKANAAGGYTSATEKGNSKSGKYTKGYDVTPKNSTYQTRIKGTPGNPSENGRWTGERGESIFISEDPRVKGILDRHNVKGVEYKNGMPDFSPFAVGEVKLENMTDHRPTNFSEADTKLAKKWSSAEKTYTKEDVEAWRKENKYTWHELNDVKTIQLIPSDINRPIFRHFGGCAEYGLMEEF